MLFSAWSELRFAARRLRRVPGFAAATVFVLALGVGATTAAFSVVNAILLEPLPFPAPSRLVRLTHVVGEPGPAAVDQSDASVLLYQEAARAFDGVAAWRFADGNLGASRQDPNAIRVRGARVTSNFFDVLGVRPALGRTFAPGEDRPGKNGVVVLSARVWKKRYGGDPNTIGRQVVVNDVPRVVVGIMPESFAYPAGQVEVWLPLSLDPARTEPAAFDLTGIARMKRGVSIAAAQADLARVLADGRAAAAERVHLAPRVQPLRDSIVGSVSGLLWLVFASAILVLVVACANVAGLFLVRAERMQVELAVRAALGSGLAGMLALSLGEAALLATGAGGAGILMAALAVGTVRRLGAALALPRLEEVGVDARVLSFAVGTAVLCALLVSAAPLLRAHRVSMGHALRSAGTTGDRAHRRGRSVLVAAQVAFGVVLVTASGLMTRSFVRLSAVSPGFDADHVVATRVLLPFARYDAAARRAFFDALVSRVRATPGVRDAGLTDWVPLSGDHHDVAVEVEPNPSPADHPVALVGASYFATLHIPLLRGRTLGMQDAAHPLEEAVVARAFAERYWPGDSPLGKRIRPAGDRWYTVVGEAADAHYAGLDKAADEMVYLPILDSGGLALVARTAAGDGATLAAVRAVVRTLDAAVPTYEETPLRRLVDDASGRARALVALLAAASVVTLALAAVGLYGVMEAAVGARRREIGVRMALGAPPRAIRRMVSLAGLRLAGIGIAAGVIAAFSTSRLLASVLYGVGPNDLATLVTTTAIVLAVAFAATWIPARRAASVDPCEALRLQ